MIPRQCVKYKIHNKNKVQAISELISNRSYSSVSLNGLCDKIKISLPFGLAKNQN